MSLRGRLSALLVMALLISADRMNVWRTYAFDQAGNEVWFDREAGLAQAQ